MGLLNSHTPKITMNFKVKELNLLFLVLHTYWFYYSAILL